MTIAIDASPQTAFSQDRLSGISRANALDRWIYVFTAACLIAVVFAGFIPDSIAKLSAVDAGRRAPFPLVLHVHAVLMGSFLLLVLAQTLLVAVGKRRLHMQLGIAAMVIAPAMVITGIILAPTMFHIAWNAALAAPPAAKHQLQNAVSGAENILLRQFSAGILFSVFMWIALRARKGNAGLHKRMILLAITPALGAAISRIGWLPTTMPNSSITLDLFALLTISPMFAWDLYRNRSIHRAYIIFVAFYVPVVASVHLLWNTAWWHATAHHIMGV
jgi:hypothetical protein